MVVLNGSAPHRLAAGGCGMDELSRLPLLSGVAPEALRHLAAQLRWRSLAAGEMVVDMGDASDDVFFLAEGAVRVVLRSAAGKELILNDLVAGDVFGELSAIDGVGRSANVTALVRSRLCIAPARAFMELVLNSPEAAQRLLRLLSARLRENTERSLEEAALPLRHRVLAELLRLSRDRGGGERAVSPPPAQHVLAARLGLRRETVSRELAKLARERVLTISRRAIILHHPGPIRTEIDGLLQASS
jgi:CRP-like cAMP-binding protein